MCCYCGEIHLINMNTVQEKLEAKILKILLLCTASNKEFK